RSLIPRGRGWRPSRMDSAGAPRAPSCLGLGRRGLSFLRSLNDCVSWARRTSPFAYYNQVRTPLSLGKDAPCPRPIEWFGDIIAQPILGGLHHRYARI